MQIISLNGAWQLTQADTQETAPAQVPGCVHTALLAHGKLADPFYRDNELQQMWIGETDWLYTRLFDVEAATLAHERVLLRCKGLDTIATISINGAEVTKTDNMHRTYEIDVKNYLQTGENRIEVHLAAPMPYARHMDATKGEMAGWVEPMRINSAAWIRKEPCNFGWDWGPKMVTSGIWREVDLVAFSGARLQTVETLQHHSENKVALTVNLQAERISETPITAKIKLHLDGEPILAETVTFEGDSASATLNIDDPQLWWVNGLGEQSLYDLSITLHAADQLLDVWENRIGLRTLTLEQHPDQWGQSMYFACNSVPFFAKGANWIPISPYPAAPTFADYELFVNASADANMNMLRVWGGGIYEDDAFYNLCDQYGLAVWQDFMFACGTYPSFDQAFMDNVRAEARDNVLRLRHHACIALWCGNNEVEQGMPNNPFWLASMGWDNYALLFDELLGDVVKALAPQTGYIPGSPHNPCGDRTKGLNPGCGDTHLWAVWHEKQPFEWYRTRLDRFCSEFGFQSFPEPQTIYEFTEPQDRNITSYVMEHHQRSGIGNSTIIHYMLDWFRLPTAFESTVWLSQILQGMAMKYAVEHWRRNMPRTMGALYWQLNDMWGAASWASLDWKGNWKALHYMAKRFYAPLLISGLEDIDANTVEIHVTNDHTEPINVTVKWIVTDVQGATLEEGATDTQITPISNMKLNTLDLNHLVASHTKRDLIIWLELWVGDQLFAQNTALLSRPKHLELRDPEIALDIQPAEDEEGAFDVTVSAKAAALYMWLELNGAKLDDNFFDLRPNQVAMVRVNANASLEDIRANLRVQSLFNTYR